MKVSKIAILAPGEKWEGPTFGPKDATNLNAILDFEHAFHATDFGMTLELSMMVKRNGANQWMPGYTSHAYSPEDPHRGLPGGGWNCRMIHVKVTNNGSAPQAFALDGTFAEQG